MTLAQLETVEYAIEHFLQACITRGVYPFWRMKQALSNLASVMINMYRINAESGGIFLPEEPGKLNSHSAGAVFALAAAAKFSALAWNIAELQSLSQRRLLGALPFILLPVAVYLAPPHPVVSGPRSALLAFSRYFSLKQRYISMSRRQM